MNWLKRLLCFAIGHRWSVERVSEYGSRLTILKVIGTCPRCGKDGTGKFLKF